MPVGFEISEVNIDNLAYPKEYIVVKLPSSVSLPNAIELAEKFEFVCEYQSSGTEDIHSTNDGPLVVFKSDSLAYTNFDIYPSYLEPVKVLKSKVDDGDPLDNESGCSIDGVVCKIKPVFKFSAGIHLVRGTEIIDHKKLGLNI